MAWWDDLLDVASVVSFPVALTRGAIQYPAGLLTDTAKDALFPDAPPGLEKIPAPPPPPDLTDVAVRQARLGARRRALGGAGLSSTFLSGPLGDMSAPTIRAPAAGGY